MNEAEACEPPPKRHKGFLSARERMDQVWKLMEKFGSQQPSVDTMAAVDRKHRCNIALSAAAIQSANRQLTAPLRMRFDHGLRPCSQCVLSVDTAYNIAAGECTSCQQFLCKTCLEKHATKSCRARIASKQRATSDDSTDDSASASSSESDISIE